MSAQKIIQALQQLVQLHQEMRQIASEKTEMIKAKDTDGLSSLLVKEQKQIQLIAKVENQRGYAVREFLVAFNKTEATLQEVIELADHPEAEALENLKQELIQEIDRLKDLNKLNQDLLVQSLQFINLSLDLMRPPENYNYDKENKEPAPKSMSMFDSKA